MLASCGRQAIAPRYRQSEHESPSRTCPPKPPCGPLKARSTGRVEGLEGRLLSELGPRNDKAPGALVSELRQSQEFGQFRHGAKPLPVQARSKASAAVMARSRVATLRGTSAMTGSALTRKLGATSLPALAGGSNVRYGQNLPSRARTPASY
jgi:hypothetical protein